MFGTLLQSKDDADTKSDNDDPYSELMVGNYFAITISARKTHLTRELIVGCGAHFVILIIVQLHLY